MKKEKPRKSVLQYAFLLVVFMFCFVSFAAQYPGWTVYNPSNSGLPSYFVMLIAIDSSDNKWIGTDSGLTKFDGTNWTTYDTSNSGLPANSVHSIAIDDSGNKWIGTFGGGLAKFDGINWTVYNATNSGMPDNEILSIAIDSNGNINPVTI